MIELAKNGHPHLTFYVANANDIPIDNNVCQIVSSSLVMHYIKNLKPVFNEIARVLAPGGKFIFSIHPPISECFKGGKMQSTDIQPLLEPYFHNSHYYWEMCGVNFLSFFITHLNTSFRVCAPLVL